MSTFDHGTWLELTLSVVMRDGRGQALKLETGQKPHFGKSGMRPQAPKDVDVMKRRCALQVQ